MTTWTDPDLGKPAEQLFAERTQRMNDAYQMKQPDRIPTFLGIGYLVAEMAGITRQTAHEDFEQGQAALEQAALYFNGDTNYGVWGEPFTSEALGDQMTRWPGHGLGPNEPFQFVEKEFMKAEDYDDFLFDPSDWGLRTYLPRAFSKLAGLAELPPFGMVNAGYMFTLNLISFASPAMMEAYRAIAKTFETLGASFGYMMQSMERMAALGFPQPDVWNAVAIISPFDFMSDTLRGMRGIMLDMHRRPDKLLAAIEKSLKIQVDFALRAYPATGLPYVQIPLHRGSDGFMSLPQFEKFYWPSFKRMIEQLIDHGVTPFVFYEGVWDQRLDYLQELPKGKTLGMFEKSDIFRVKEKLGDVMCIMGGMPNSMLMGASVEDIRSRTKQVCEVCGRDGGFIMTTGVGELEGADPKLVKTWVDATKEFGTYK